MNPSNPRLSPREAQILTMIGRCYTYKAIADELHISRKTVDKHATSCHKKLGCFGIGALIHHAILFGFVKPGEFRKF